MVSAYTLLKKSSYVLFAILSSLAIPFLVYYGIAFLYPFKDNLDPQNRLGRLFRHRSYLEKRLEKSRLLKCTLLESNDVKIQKAVKELEVPISNLEKEFQDAQLAYDKMAIELDKQAADEEKKQISALFFTCLLVGALAFLASSLITVTPISIGAAFGSIFTFILGSYFYWDYMHAGIKCLLLITLLILLFSLSYRISRLK